MKRQLFYFFLFMCLAFPLSTTAQVVDIPDSNLRAAVEDALGVASGDTITASEMATLTRLEAPEASISDLTGLEGATKLTRLDLGDNAISDISVLAGLPNLTNLSLDFNNITDISVLAGLPNLINLALGYNAITDHSILSGLTNLIVLDLRSTNTSDLSVLSGLTKLERLYIDRNGISDLAPLAGLTNLTHLGLVGNDISDVSALVGLTNLKWMRLAENNITDLSPLVANTGLGSGDWIDVKENPLNRASIQTHIPALQSRGVTVEFDNVITELVNIPDLNLRAAIENALGKGSGSIITTADMGRLTEFVAQNSNITDLTGLEHATNLARLDLGTERVEGGHEVNSNSVSDLSPLAGLINLTWLRLRNNSISDLSPLARLTNLTWLNLGGNLIISDISALSGLTNLEILWLYGNSISDLSPLAGLTNLTFLEFSNNLVSDLSPLAGLTNLTDLGLRDNSISDISPVAGLTNLTSLSLNNNSISDISPVAGLTNLTSLSLSNNSISDISPVAGLTNLTGLGLGGNSISDLSPVAGLTNLTFLILADNSIVDLSSVADLTNLTFLILADNSIVDLSPLVENTGLGSGDAVIVRGNPLNAAAINTHIPALQGRGVTVEFGHIEPVTSEFFLSIPRGISLIHVPLKVTAVDGVEKTIESIGDLYDALGGASKVTFLITYDSQVQDWLSYFGTSDKGMPADRVLTDEMGIIASMIDRVDIQLSGEPLGANGTSTITLNQRLNLVGLPLNNATITRVSDLLELNGIKGNVPVIIVTDEGEFKAVGRADDPGDIPIVGGQSFILTAQRTETVTISGDGWTNTLEIAAAPSMALTGIEVGDTTPVLGLRGAIVDEETGLKVEGFRVTVKNLSTDRAVASVTTPNEAGYRLTVVDIETGRAAQIGDILEISAQSLNPFIGVEPLRYIVTAEDVLRSRIQLPELVVYEIPSETQLLRNYPNPFNPETWIPYRLAEDAFVTLTIYDLNGQVVRTLDVGHQIAAVYESRSKAVYWDGRNGLGEQVASGVYFYHLSAGDYSATRKMLIIK